MVNFNWSTKESQFIVGEMGDSLVKRWWTPHREMKMGGRGLWVGQGEGQARDGRWVLLERRQLD